MAFFCLLFLSPSMIATVASSSSNRRPCK
uniref:Uncharacterized protein n=1 Tax=Anguilla anguilla TaxID=7936 RepID=A0A0E9WE62_ANGAN